MPGRWVSLPAHPKGAFGTPRPTTRRTDRPDVSYGTVAGAVADPADGVWRRRPGVRAYAGSEAASAIPAAFAASRTAPATAPATLSLKTDGMM